MAASLYRAGVAAARVAGQVGNRGLDVSSAAWDTCPLSRRQLDVLQFLSAGCTNAETGRLMNLSTETVAVHVANIQGRLEKAGGGRLNRTAAVTLALARGWIGFPGGSPGKSRITSTEEYR